MDSELAGLFEPSKKSTREIKKWEEKCEKCPLPILQNMLIVQPPPQALRFSHGRGERETSDW